MTQQTTDRAAHNIALVQKGYAAFATGDIATISGMFGPDMTWHAQRLGRLGGDHRGLPAVLRFFAESMELTQGTFRVEPQSFLANDRSVAVVVRSSGRRGATVLDDRQIHLFELDGDTVSEVWQYVGDGELVGAFWA
jgi:uncharacterized protein